ncbi:MAG TPA: Ldh family oxidoreductase [Caulobacteraceae bacterium]|jgi:LDH2 family malate/lactate/ureidoglycolate dehydrogenase|nr:Ldh family oxidoreductase [Caulobacteraceae bacterium]
MLSLDALRACAAALLAAAGCDDEKAGTVARLLVAADAMGHTTHGLAQLPGYLAELERGGMRGTGRPTIVADRGAAVVWDGERLPGVWLTERALALAVERAASVGICAVSIRRSHHIACLAAFLPYATERGMLAIISCSDPSVASVAPFGSREAVFTPDPIAVGIPTPGEPILIDTSASITTNGMAARLRAEGQRFPGAWAIDAAGRPTDDPNALIADPPGALLPTGGLDHGQKGYALALMIEALTQGLSGHGRADHETQWGASVFVQVFDPALFGGAEAFIRQTGHIADLCRAAAPLDPASPVRLPGQSALSRQREAEAHGIVLHSGVLEALAPAAARYGVVLPQDANG